MTDIIEQIRQRETEHQQLHERDASIPSCLPAGCSPDQGDIPVLIAVVDSLTQKLRIEREFSKTAVNAQGHIDCPACETAQPAHDLPTDVVETVDEFMKARYGDRWNGKPSFDDIEDYQEKNQVVLQSTYPNQADALPLQSVGPDEQLTASAETLAGIDGPRGWSVSGKEIAEHVDSAASKRARPNAGRPRNCPNSKTCRGRLKSAMDKEAGLCRKCRKAAKA